MARSRQYGSEQRKALRGPARKATLLRQDYRNAAARVVTAKDTLRQTRVGIDAFRNLDLLARVLDRASDTINTRHRDTDGHLYRGEDQGLMTGGRRLADVLEAEARRLAGLDSKQGYAPLEEVLEDARTGVQQAKAAASAISWESFEHYRDHRTEYVAMAILGMTDAGIEYHGPELPAGVDGANLMAVASFAVHVAHVKVIPIPPQS